MRDDAERWDERYAGRSPGDPAPPDGVEAVELPARGRCLDVACGLGAQSLWAASVGFEVVALDVSPVAIAALVEAAARYGLDPSIDGRVVDLDDGLPADLAGTCALVLCQRFRDPRLYPALAAALVPGGALVITVLSQVGASDPGPFHAPPGELLAAFAGLRVERHREGDGIATLIGFSPSVVM